MFYKYRYECPIFRQVAVFGEGTYLSSELSVSLMYSQAAEACKHSLIGSKLSCVAMCEMIDDPSVKCQIKEGNFKSHSYFFQL